MTVSIIKPRIITLKDGTRGTLVPIPSSDLEQLPPSLISYLHNQFNGEIEHGDTYPQVELLDEKAFIDYWFGYFHALLVRTDDSVDNTDQHALFHWLNNQEDHWDDVWLGSFYVKPNYIGRSSHVCNGGFLVNPKIRGAGIGKALGASYVIWASQLGYVYSVFNLVFATNEASIRIWDSLGFDRIGRVPAAGKLKGHDGLVDAIIFGKSFTESAKTL